MSRFRTDGNCHKQNNKIEILRKEIKAIEWQLRTCRNARDNEDQQITSTNQEMRGILRGFVKVFEDDENDQVYETLTNLLARSEQILEKKKESLQFH